jgi:hypothetical protein
LGTEALARANLAISTSQSSSDVANTALITSDQSFNQSNVATVIAQASFDQSNVSIGLANYAADKANTNGNTVSSVSTVANDAFVLATTANTTANIALLQTQNNAVQIANTSIRLNSAYDTANVALATAATALNIDNQANAAFDTANSALVLAQDAYDFANTIISDTQVDPLARTTANDAFDTANSATVLAQAAFNAANTGVNVFDQDLNTSDDVIFNDISSANIIAVSVDVSGKTSLTQVVETFTSIANANSVVTHDCSTGQIFNHTSIDDNFTANFTNLNLESGKATTITLVLNQGGTAYIANTVQIESSAQTINWSANTVPTGNVNAVDVISFSIFNNSGTHIVLGQLSTFG